MAERSPMWTRVAALRDRLIQLRQALEYLHLSDFIRDEDIALLADTSMILQRYLDPDQQQKERAAIWDRDPQRKPRG
jgi:hypothetical protein